MAPISSLSMNTLRYFPLKLLAVTHMKGTGEKEMDQHAPVALDVWIYFNLVTNTILLPILVATFLFSKRAKRHPTLVNVLVTWIFSGIFSLLLFYAGQHRPGIKPNKTLCIVQTSLLYGINPMWSVAVLMLVYYMNTAFSQDHTKLSRFKMIMMLSAPYIAQCGFSLAMLIAALDSPNKVNRTRRDFYCSLNYSALSNAMAIFTFVVYIGITILEVQLAATLCRNWRGIRKAGRSSGVDFQVVLRVVVFGIYIFFGMIVNVVSIFDEHSPVPDLFAATVGTVVLLVFGTQADVFRAWCFWRTDAPPKPQLIYLPRDPSWRYSIDLSKSAGATEKGVAPDLARPPVARAPSR